jgi:predicted metal-binding protein
LPKESKEDERNVGRNALLLFSFFSAKPAAVPYFVHVGSCPDKDPEQPLAERNERRRKKRRPKRSFALFVLFGRTRRCSLLRPCRQLPGQGPQNSLLPKEAKEDERNVGQKRSFAHFVLFGKTRRCPLLRPCRQLPGQGATPNSLLPTETKEDERNVGRNALLLFSFFSAKPAAVPYFVHVGSCPDKEQPRTPSCRKKRKRTKETSAETFFCSFRSFRQNPPPFLTSSMSVVARTRSNPEHLLAERSERGRKKRRPERSFALFVLFGQPAAVPYFVHIGSCPDKEQPRTASCRQKRKMTKETSAGTLFCSFRSFRQNPPLSLTSSMSAVARTRSNPEHLLAERSERGRKKRRPKRSFALFVLFGKTATVLYFVHFGSCRTRSDPEQPLAERNETGRKKRRPKSSFALFVLFGKTATVLYFVHFGSCRTRSDPEQPLAERNER